MGLATRDSESHEAGTSAEAGARIADALVQTLQHFGVEATVIGEISGPRVTRYELQLAGNLHDETSYLMRCPLRPSDPG
jgi:DNA segregation ATPase FtsK/SpoIIIE-like protein